MANTSMVHIPRFLVTIEDTIGGNKKRYELFETEQAAKAQAHHFVSYGGYKCMVIGLKPDDKVNGKIIYRTEVTSKLVSNE